jgi:hypothetical protein
MPDSKPDSTFSKRTVVKRSGPGPLKIPKPVTDVVSDITGGFRELQRQMGSAVSNVQRGYQKIKSFVK